MLKKLFYALFIRPLVLVVIGLNIENREGLPKKGPAIIVANHNSHLDTLVLSSLFPLRIINKIRPVAAADYFLKNGFMRFIALQLIGIIPIKRVKANRDSKDPFQESYAALEKGDILVLFPEGTRGEPEQLEGFKNGIARLAAKNPKVPVYPIFLHGLGKALPKGEGMFVPFFCTILVGDHFFFKESKKTFMDKLNGTFDDLVKRNNFQPWD